jgi:hypothetical protein
MRPGALRRYNVRENAGVAQLKVRSKMDNVAGVQLPQFESYSEGADVFELTGLGRGGQQVQHCKKTYKNAVQLLTELATLQVHTQRVCQCVCMSEWVTRVAGARACAPSTPVSVSLYAHVCMTLYIGIPAPLARVCVCLCHCMLTPPRPFVCLCGRVGVCRRRRPS